MDYVNVIKNVVTGLPAGLSSEAHVVAEIYHKLRCYGDIGSNKIRLEWPYPSPYQWKCDIFLDIGTGIWIEVKAYPKGEADNVRSGKHTGDESSPVAACNKLKEIKDAKKILVIYQDVVYEPTKEGHSWNEIEHQCQCKENGVVFIRREPK